MCVLTINILRVYVRRQIHTYTHTNNNNNNKQKTRNANEYSGQLKNRLDRVLHSSRGLLLERQNEKQCFVHCECVAEERDIERDVNDMRESIKLDFVARRKLLHELQ